LVELQEVTMQVLNTVRIVFAVAMLLLSACSCEELAAPPPQTQNFEQLRKSMVETQIRSRGVRNESVLRAMGEVPRHEFVPPELRVRAYDDGPLPIGLDQTISQPYIVALMTELVEPMPNHRVLEVGTGSGYQAAVIARLVSQVSSIEIIPEHAETAAGRLKRLGVKNVEVRAGNGYLGWPERAPFDGILVTAGATEVPPRLVEQLKPGGLMIIPVGSTLSEQILKVIQKDALGKIETRDVIPVRFVPLRRQ
jgi:protein-L-isoaspartate(D-aspartate) O-methyltransferase